MLLCSIAGDRSCISGGLTDIDKGWDGTSRGHQVPVGVYFIVVEARGADGVVYKHKGDINILR